MVPTTTSTAPGRAEAWARIPDAPINPGLGTTATWTGRELIVIGGMPSGKVEEAGMTAAAAAYDPATNRWRKLPPPPGAGRSLHAVAWTGTELIVWGGRRPGDYGADGAAYDPAADAWRPLPAAPIDGRWAATVVWTGKEVIIWGGNGGRPTDQALARREGYDTDRGDGAAYDPATNRWRALAPSPLSPRIAAGVWTGNELLIVAGSRDDEGGGSPVSDAAAYDPATDTWRRLTSPRPPAGGRYQGPKLWTGHELLVAGDHNGRARWEAYQPTTDTWRVLPSPPRVDNHGPSAAWTGREMLLWGAVYNCNPFADCTTATTGQAGLRYTPAS